MNIPCVVPEDTVIDEMPLGTLEMKGKSSPYEQMGEAVVAKHGRINITQVVVSMKTAERLDKLEKQYLTKREGKWRVEKGWPFHHMNYSPVASDCKHIKDNTIYIRKP